jgi:hypothetical protein
MYGKNNRILYSAKFSQGFKVVAAKRTRQAAGVFNGGTKIRMTGRAGLERCLQPLHRVLLSRPVKSFVVQAGNSEDHAEIAALRKEGRLISRSHRG